jgi:alkylhydroperoxidase family enzyme
VADGESEAFDALMRGYRDTPAGVPAICRAVGHNPALLAAWGRYNGLLVSGSSLAPAVVELAILAAAVAMDSPYSFAHHAAKALDAGHTGEQLRGLRHWSAMPDRYDRTQRLVLRAVDEMTRGHRLGTTTFTAALDEFGEAGAVDLVELVTFYLGFDVLVESLGVEVEEVHRHWIEEYWPAQ